jgi:hypothetical protein
MVVVNEEREFTTFLVAKIPGPHTEKQDVRVQRLHPRCPRLSRDSDSEK